MVVDCICDMHDMFALNMVSGEGASVLFENVRAHTVAANAFNFALTF